MREGELPPQSESSNLTEKFRKRINEIRNGATETWRDAKNIWKEAGYKEAAITHLVSRAGFEIGDFLAKSGEISGHPIVEATGKTLAVGSLVVNSLSDIKMAELIIKDSMKRKTRSKKPNKK